MESNHEKELIKYWNKTIPYILITFVIFPIAIILWLIQLKTNIGKLGILLWASFIWLSFFGIRLYRKKYLNILKKPLHKIEKERFTFYLDESFIKIYEKNSLLPTLNVKLESFTSIFQKENSLHIKTFFWMPRGRHALPINSDIVKVEHETILEETVLNQVEISLLESYCQNSQDILNQRERLKDEMITTIVVLTNLLLLGLLYFYYFNTIRDH